MQNKLTEFKDVFDKIILKLGFVKQQVFDLRNKNDELVLENERLAVRAAAGFDNLTPRPDYNQIQEDKLLKMNVIDPKTKK